jgi:hypothetical protein
MHGPGASVLYAETSYSEASITGDSDLATCIQTARPSPCPTRRLH